MSRVLIIADLEGVAGVDEPSALIVGGAGYEGACRHLTTELNAAIAGFRAAGWDSFRVSDSHRSGTEDTNLILAELDCAAEVYTGADAYSEEAFTDVGLIACIGMHAGAGTAGFIPHTVSLHCDWRYGGRSLSESDIVLALAAEAGIPCAFISGDDVLGAELAGRVPTVVTKQALSPVAAQSVDPGEAQRQLYRAAGETPRHVGSLGNGCLELHFKSAWQARAAVRCGAPPLSPYAVQVEGASFREAYARAHALMGPTAEPMLHALRGRPGEAEFLEDAVTLIVRPFPETAAKRMCPSLDTLERTRDAFLRWTDHQSEFSRVLRALILHMLQCHAPAVFEALDLQVPLEKALAGLSAIGSELPPDLPAHLGMSRVDAWYLRQRRGLEGGRPEAEALGAYLHALHQHGQWSHAWLLGEMAHLLGVEAPRDKRQRPWRPISRLQDLYWLTHLFLLETDYLGRPLEVEGWESTVEELFLAVPWILAREHTDLAGEVALCLQLAGEEASAEHAALVEFIGARQQRDGTLMDGSMGDAPEVYADHATGVALLVQAGAARSKGLSE